MNRFLNRVLIGRDINQARWRMRLAWVAGFLLFIVYLFNAMVYLFTSATLSSLWSGGQFPLVVVETGLIGLLSYGVLKRVRVAAASLFCYFWISRSLWLALGLISMEELADDVARFLLLDALPAYLFFQGMRGAWTFHFLTHPPIRETAPTQEPVG